MENNKMTKDKQVGLAVNIIATIILLAVSAYLISHFYDKGVEAGYKKGKTAGWNQGYQKGQESILELVEGMQTQDATIDFDQSNIKRKLTDIEMKLDEAEWQRKFGN